MVTREAASTPQRIGPAASFGFGDRTGRATPGHIRAMRATNTRFVPVFAQQSARELERTGRTFAEVMAAAAQAVDAAGWTEPWGADADHLRTPDEVRSAVEAGFTMLTLDPSAHVRDAVGDLDVQVRSLPWQALEDDWPAMRARHASAGTTVALASAAATYGHALAHVAELARAAAGTDVDIEVSVDETDLPTSPFAHRFLAVELRRLGVPFTSLAPRFAGRWHKGVDVGGDLGAIRRSIEEHAAVPHDLGGYKLSVHSGSDKFSAYPLLAQLADGVHVKTSGTSYLEALRVAALADEGLFNAILRLARERFATDRASYELGAGAGIPERVADPAALLDDAGARQALHVTFGAVLAHPEVGPALLALLDANEEAYASVLELHFARHLVALR